VRVEAYAHYVNKLRQNVGLETWLYDVKLWRHKQRTSNTNDTLDNWMNAPMKIFCVRHCLWRRVNLNLLTDMAFQSNHKNASATHRQFVKTTEWTPPWKFSAYATACDVESIWIYWPMWHFNPIIKMHLLPTDNSLSADCEQSSKTAFALHQWPRLHCAWKKKEKLLLVFAGGCLDFLLTRISEVRCRKSLPIIVWALEGGRGDQDPPGFWNY